MTTNCPSCIQFSNRPHKVPSFPWQKLDTYLFDYQRAQYLLETDYYSKYPVVRKRKSTTSAAIIKHLKSVFAEQGIPETVISDNGPRYNSQEFAAFFNQWGIDHVTSSPVKKPLRKAVASGQDLYLAPLTHRTTPVDKNLPSSAQLPNQ